MEDDISLGRTVVLGIQISTATLQLTVGRLYFYMPTIGQLWARYWPATGQLQARYWPAIGRVQALCRPYVGLFRPYMYWPYLGRIQTGTDG